MPRLALANTFWESFDALEKPVKAGVRKAMAKFQALTVAELHADKGLHLESVEKARDPRMRTIRINDFWRGARALRTVRGVQACTRAREALHVSWSGAPGPFLPIGKQVRIPRRTAG